ncbi:TIGR02234 family membrane protein [Sphaerisporangium perillae]|uniref:TIGR02234 family membrane protein n=1 Tax=Sphaerisporangium perillae TaxID=2935860 RepID=UPI00200F4A9B|nr:TIGR02234 family membrane protein [Sphaerisporangium perillae]
MTAAGAPPRAGATRDGARRALPVWVAAGVAGAALVLFASGRTWAQVAFPAAPGGGVHTAPVALSGGDLAPVLSPLALASLAAVVAVLATRGLWRRVVGVLLALLGAAVTVGAWQGAFQAHMIAVAETRVTLTSMIDVVVSPARLWPVLAITGGLVLVAAGALAAVRGGRWPGMSDRYERQAPPLGAARAERPGRAERSLWDALDRGDDPTDAEGPGHRPE